MNSLEPHVVRQAPAVLGPHPVPTAPVDGMELNPRQIFRAIRRHIVIVLLAPACAMLVSAVLTAMTPRQYQAVATLQIEQNASRVLSTDDTQPAAAAQDAERFLQTQIGLLNSKALAAQVVDSLDLARDDQALRGLGMPPQAAARLTTVAARREALVAMVRAGLTVTLPRDSRIAQIAFKGPDPKLCARIANGYVRTFIVYNLQRRFQDSSYALAFLRDQLGQAKQRLEDSERAKVDYATRARLVETNPAGAQGSRGGDITTSTAAHLHDLTTALASAQAARIEAQARWEEAQRMPLMSLPEVLQSSAIETLMERRAVARSDYQKERERRKPDFPAMQQAQAQITELDTQMQGIATSIRDSLHNRFTVALQNEQALLAQLDQIKSTALGEEGLSIEYNILSREVDTNRTMYDGLLQRYKEVSAASGVTANNITAVDTAELPTFPVSPKLKINLASAGLAGALAALMVVFVREKFSDKIHTPEDVSGKLGVRFLGALPGIPTGSTMLREFENPLSQLSEATVSIRAVLEYLVVSGERASVVVTSSHATESRLAFAHALARDFAKGGRRALLIDADLRTPTLHALLQCGNETGLSTVLAGCAPPDAAVRPSIAPNLDLLPAGPPPADPAELLSGQRFSGLLDHFGDRYGVVVINAPPAQHLADALLIAAFANATIMMLDAGVSESEAARASIARLNEVGATLGGAVLARYGAPRAAIGVFEVPQLSLGLKAASAPRLRARRPRREPPGLTRRRRAG